MTDHERQGTSYDPDARGHELAGRDRAPDFKWHTCGSCGQRWGDEAADYERCPACLTAGARLLAAAREVVTQVADFENMTDEAAAAMRELRAVVGPLGSITVGVDLSSGPDTGGYLCGRCGFASSDADAMLAHECAPGGS